MSAWLLALMLMRQAEKPKLLNACPPGEMCFVSHAITPEDVFKKWDAQMGHWVEQHCVAVLPGGTFSTQLTWAAGGMVCRDSACTHPEATLKLRCKP